jgi:hypothetical protein
MSDEKSNKEINQWANDLVNASVGDLVNSLYFYQGSDDDLRVLNKALQIVTRRGEGTKAKLLQAKIKKLSKVMEVQS